MLGTQSAQPVVKYGMVLRILLVAFGMELRVRQKALLILSSHSLLALTIQLRISGAHLVPGSLESSVD